MSLCKRRIPLEKKKALPPFPHSKSPTSINKAMVSYRVAMLSRRRVRHSVCVCVLACMQMCEKSCACQIPIFICIYSVSTNELLLFIYIFPI